MSAKSKKKISNFLFLFPSLLLFCVVVVYPFLKGAKISFTNWDGLSNVYNWVGFDNYIRLFSDSSIIEPVKNVSDFGAFVDIGVHQDGLVHKSQMADKFVKHPLDIVKVGDIVEVRILDVDLKRKRISLSMKKEG